MSDVVDIRERLFELRDRMDSIKDLMDKLPIPATAREYIEEKIIQDKELNELIYAVDHPQATKVFLMGRTGVGKSALVNALCSQYVAEVNDVQSHTMAASRYTVIKDDQEVLEVFDSRGIAEAQNLAADNQAKEECMNAEKQLISEVVEYQPDLIVYVMSCSSRDYIAQDARAICEMRARYKAKYEVELPVLVVLNRADEVPPKSKAMWEKAAKYMEIIRARRTDLRANGLFLETKQIIAVSSYIEWADAEGNVLDEEEIRALTPAQRLELQIAEDQRYNIEEFKDLMLESIKNFSAALGLSPICKAERFLKGWADKVVNSFASLAAVIAVTDRIPVTDMVVLTGIQTIMVYMIAILGRGRTTFEEAKQFVVSMLSLLGVGYVVRAISRKLLQLIPIPGVGDFINASLASGTTKVEGTAAIEYYIQEVDLDTVKKHFKENMSLLSSLMKKKKDEDEE